MKKHVLINLPILLFIIHQANAISVDFSGPFDKNVIHLKNHSNSTQIFISNYKQQQFLVYQSNYRYQDRDSVSTLADTPDLIDIGFSCGKNTEDFNFCTRFFNRRTNQMSSIFTETIDHNAKQNVVAYQVLSKNLVVVTPIFEKCSNPFTYKIKIYPDTDFGEKTKFLQKGDLQLDYVDLNNKLVLKKIPIDYKKLYQRCGVKALALSGPKST